MDVGPATAVSIQVHQRAPHNPTHSGVLRRQQTHSCLCKCQQLRHRAVLMQQHSEGWKPVAYCSRRLNEAETRYAQIEKECLASVWACERFGKYLHGLEGFRLITDHKLLVPLMNSEDLDNVPIRCQRLLMRLMRFNPTAEYAPGKTLVTADTLSRSPVGEPQERDYTHTDATWHPSWTTCQQQSGRWTASEMPPLLMTHCKP